MGAYPQGNNKERKLWLVLRGLVSCGFCPYHRRENSTEGGWKNYRTDKYKSKYRLQRKFKLEQIERNKQMEQFIKRCNEGYYV